MATNRPFAYNTGTGISGTIQVGSLAVGIPTAGFAATGKKWWAGPDEDLGYVIAYSQPDGLHPTPETGTTAYVGFKRTVGKTDAAFIALANQVAYGQTGSFASATLANTWLNTNGYWTSYVDLPSFYYDPGNSSSYSGAGTTLNNIGLLGNTAGATGTLSGVAYEGGIAGGAFNFDGLADKITFGQYNFGNTITVSAWVYPRAEYSINCLMANCGANTNTNGFKMSWNNWNSTNYTMNFEAGNSSAGGTTSTASNTVVANTWQMITYVFNKSAPSIKFYKNGVEIATASGGNPVSNIGTNNTNWWMGAIGGNSYYMNANVGTFKIWTTIKSESEILADFNSTKSRYGL